MVRESLERIQQSEQEARTLLQKAKEEGSADLARAAKEAEELVKKAETQSREQAKETVARAKREGEGRASEISQKAGSEIEKLRAQAKKKKRDAIHLIREKFSAQWQ